MLGRMLRNARRRLVCVLAAALGCLLLFGAEAPQEAAFPAEARRAALSILEELGFSQENLLEVRTEEGEVLEGSATVRVGGRTRTFRFMAPPGAGDLYRRIRGQLEYDMASFLFEDDPQNRLDCASGALVRCGLMGEEPRPGACYTAGDGSVLLVRKAEGTEALFDRFWARSLLPGQKLRPRRMLASLWARGGLRSAGAGVMLRIPGLYPVALVLDASYDYSGAVLIQAGAAIELPLSSLFETDFPLVANARLLVDAEAGAAVDLGRGTGLCASVGVFYDHAATAGLSWRLGFERRCQAVGGFEVLDDFQAALVWNI